MSGKAAKGSEELLQAYKQSIASGFAVMNAGMTQATAAAKLMTEATQTERDEISKVWGQTADQALKCNENLAAVVPGILSELSAAPFSGSPVLSPEVKDAVGQVIEGEVAVCQAWAQAWIQYLAGVEQRRSAMTQSLLAGNAGTFESGQDVVKSAVKFGEAFMDWSLENMSVKNK